jgi:hypothetical protein
MTTTAGTVLDRSDEPLTTQELEDLIPLLHEQAPAVKPVPPVGRVPTPRAPHARERQVPVTGRPIRVRPLSWRRRGPVLVGGLLVGLAAAAIAAVMINTSEPAPSGGPQGQLGLSLQAWQQYRAGERAGTVAPASAGLLPSEWQQYRSGERVGAADQVHMGLTQQGWQEYRAGEIG